MKKVALAILILIATVSADISQEGAVSICRPYSSDSETISIIGPIVCNGQYWVCQFTYYGNEQNILLAIDNDRGGVLDEKDADLRDIIATSYAAGDGSYLFDNVLTDYQFAVKMGGMNSTLTEYARIIESLKTEKLIDGVAYSALTKQITELKQKSSDVAKGSLNLYNISNTFITEPNCVSVIDYQDRLNETLAMALNFTASWKGFIGTYNTMASGIEDTYVATLKTSDADLMSQSLASIGPGLEDYAKYEEEYVKTVLSNTKTRFDRKESSDLLSEAYKTLKDSNNPDVLERYNEASEAFVDGDYPKANRLVREAMLMPKIIGDEPIVITEETTDYTIYIIAIGLLLGAIFVITILKKGGGKGPEGDESESEDYDKTDSKKSIKKGEWEWVKEKESSIEKKASKSTLETQ